jgi:N-acetylglucosamine-6-phosphate deacetylase
VKVPAENCLAGAALPLSACVTNMMRITSCSLAEAVQMASTNPAKSMGLDDIGEIKAGKRADMILFSIENDKMVIQKTIMAGNQVFG